MAFANKLGSLFKAAVNASNPSVFQAIRCMSSSRLFVGGLSYGTDDSSLREAFASFGEVTEARVIIDRESNRSRGFGFVSFTSTEEASNAISGLDGKELHGRMVKVNYATERTGGYRGGGGGYNGGYSGGGGYNGGYSGGGGGGGYGGDSYNAQGGGNYGGYGGDSYNAQGGGNYGGNADGGMTDQFKGDNEYASRQ